MRTSLFLPLFGLLVSLTPSWSLAPWVSLTVSTDNEGQALATLRERHIDALSWSNAVVEVSAFEGLEVIPLASLASRLTPQDPRWDPWLRSVSATFEPRSGRVSLWVAPEQVAEARTALGAVLVDDSHRRVSAAQSPASLTGWTLVVAALFAAVLFLVAGFLGGWPAWGEPRRWLWVPACALAFLLGASLLATNTAPSSSTAHTSVSWLQHRWFQEAWPWGARWDNYAPDKAWSFRSYERRNGKIAEVEATLTAADESWAEAALKGLGPHHVQRVFGTGNP